MHFALLYRTKHDIHHWQKRTIQGGDEGCPSKNPFVTCWGIAEYPPHCDLARTIRWVGGDIICGYRCAEFGFGSVTLYLTFRTLLLLRSHDIAGRMSFAIDGYGACNSFTGTDSPRQHHARLRSHTATTCHNPITVRASVCSAV